ncbi:hypothetical protein TNCT_108431 [Trichonephila clavata]|uniref:Uncharacterized protein n=1 Tax=Trichonephila clavata TaxID=2740835 RepID=A0A8X6KAF5_TRICU|nr:hypothetical protein TNCT_108431 [Trichonephila clavata]
MRKWFERCPQKYAVADLGVGSHTAVHTSRKNSGTKGFSAQKEKSSHNCKNVSNDINKEDLLKVISEQNPEIVVDDESIKQCRVHLTLKNLSAYKACCNRNLTPKFINPSYDKEG